MKLDIATDKAVFSTKNYQYFFLFLHENVCCQQLTKRLLMTTHNMFLLRNKKKIIWIASYQELSDVTLAEI